MSISETTDFKLYWEHSKVCHGILWFINHKKELNYYAFQIILWILYITIWRFKYWILNLILSLKCLYFYQIACHYKIHFLNLKKYWLLNFDLKIHLLNYQFFFIILNIWNQIISYLNCIRFLPNQILSYSKIVNYLDSWFDVAHHHC